MWGQRWFWAWSWTTRKQERLCSPPLQRQCVLYEKVVCDITLPASQLMSLILCYVDYGEMNTK